MPNHIIRQAENAVTRPLGHCGETFGLGLVFEGVAGEIDAYKDSLAITGKMIAAVDLPDR